tara:strand:+ start:293 stop:502 length:210 start_codon:yes stop_codon:yes gene_type:complete
MAEPLRFPGFPTNISPGVLVNVSFQEEDYCGSVHRQIGSEEQTNRLLSQIPSLEEPSQVFPKDRAVPEK